jgi:hypothetical protein
MASVTRNTIVADSLASNLSPGRNVLDLLVKIYAMITGRRQKKESAADRARSWKNIEF